MEFNEFIRDHIKQDLTYLYKSYINDCDKVEEFEDIAHFEEQIADLQEMTLEELMEKNLEFTMERELSYSIQEWTLEYFERFM